MDIELCTNSKRIPLMAVGYDGLRKGNYGFVGMGDFLNKTRFWNKYKALIQFKTFSQHTIISNFHRNKYNVQLPFSNAACSCKLAVQHPIFEKYRSCVCTTISLSHRFKTSEKARCTTCRYRDESRKQHEKYYSVEF